MINRLRLLAARALFKLALGIAIVSTIGQPRARQAKLDAMRDELLKMGDR